MIFDDEELIAWGREQFDMHSRGEWRPYIDRTGGGHIVNQIARLSDSLERALTELEACRKADDKRMRELYSDEQIQGWENESGW